MKTFKEFLTEEELTLIELIKKDCKQFLQQMNKGNLLYRGIKVKDLEPVGKVKIGDHSVNYFKKSIRTDRRPLSTPSNVHDVIDDWFISNFNVKARSGGMFCYSDSGKEATTSYGVTHVVFPIGNFDCVWSPEVHDLLMFIDNEGFTNSTGELEIQDFMDTLEYKKDGLKKAMTTSSEIMIVGGSYYAIRAENANQIALIKQALK